MPQYDYRALGSASLAANGNAWQSIYQWASAALPNIGGASEIPAGKQALISSINVCNQTTATYPVSTIYMIGVVQPGSVVSWITTASPLLPQETVTLSWGITLSAGDYIVVATSSLNPGTVTSRVRFTMFGSLYIP